MSLAGAPSLILHEPWQKTRADYRLLSDEAILTLVINFGHVQERADGEDEEAYFDATFALQELFAVQEERR